MRRHSIDFALAFVTLVWGFSPIVFDIILNHFDPLVFVFVRFLLLSVVAVSVLTIRGARGGRAWRVRRKDIPWLIASGLCGYGIYQLFYVTGLAHTTPFASSLLANTVPIFSAVILAVSRIERVGWLQWGGIGLSFVGIVAFLLLAGSPGGVEVIGRHLSVSEMIGADLLTVVAAILFSAYGIINKRLTPFYSGPELMCYTLLIGTVALMPFAIPATLHQDWGRVTPFSWLLIGYSVLFPIYITYSIWNWAIGKVGVAHVTLFSYPTPIVTGIFGWLLIGQSLTPGQIFAAAVVLGGMLLARWGISLAARHATNAPPREVPLGEATLTTTAPHAAI